MGNYYNQDIQKTELIWIDQNVNNEENQSYKKDIKKLMKMNFSCFTEVPGAIEYLKKLEFAQTYIICSGRLYPDFIIKYKSIINDLMICPRIIIFCGDRISYLIRNKDNDVLEINHPFYNSGGVQDNIGDVIKFLEEKGPTIEPISHEMEYHLEDRLIFRKISSECHLILPLFFSEFIKKPEEEKIEEFNQIAFKRYYDRYELNAIFSQLVQTKNIPNEILYKFWLRAYSSEGNLSKDLSKMPNASKEITTNRNNESNKIAGTEEIYKETEETATNNANASKINEMSKFKTLDERINDNEISFISYMSENEKKYEKENKLTIKSNRNIKRLTEHYNKLLLGYKEKERKPMSIFHRTRALNLKTDGDLYRENINLLRLTNREAFKIQEQKELYDLKLLEKKIKISAINATNVMKGKTLSPKKNKH